MMMSNMHRLLRRQIRKANFDTQDLEKFNDFFNVINDAYKSFDDDVRHIELILEESSNELYKLNKNLRTEKESVKNELNTIVNTIEGVIFKTDLNGDFKYLNKAWEDVFNIPIEIALNKNYKDLLFSSMDQDALRAMELEAIKQTEFNTLFKHTTFSNKTLWIQLRLSLTYDESGAANGYIGTFNDVTQLKETEIKLNRANKTKDEFLSTMSHEIRTPLNAVIGMSDILLMDKFLPEQLENFQVLKYSSEHLLALINDLLDLNKFKSQEIKISEEDFNLSELVQNIQLHFKQVALNKKLSFETIIDSSIPMVLNGDSLKLSQVLKNLLSNAFKFTHDGGVVFKIENIQTKEETASIRFSVKDSGIGVSYDKQKDIFKSFVQASNNTSTIYGGTGLGLHISKELLNIQNSNLHLESNIGKGSTFWFDITFKTSKKVLTDEHNISSQREQIDLKVLIAEDNKFNALILGKLLKNWNVDFVLAKNGQQALDIYSSRNFDVILMDLQMPILDGYDTTRIIRKMDDKIKSTIPIIALTAFTKSEVSAKTERYKMNGYISKPFDINELHSLLKHYSENKRHVV